MRNLLYIFLVGLFFPNLSFGQDAEEIFTQDQLLWYVQKYHPVSIQGQLILKQGESTVRKARGGFDPYLFSNLDQKAFDDKSYYSILGSGLKVPTWYGIELKTGYDQNSGAYLNPENNLPGNGLWYAGISVPIGQGLFIDNRRATLKRAKIFAESTVAEQQQLMNDLYFDAIKQYWKWVEVYNQFKVYEESLELALVRFNAVKNSYIYGDKPAIDTLEAFLQVQNRQMSMNQYELLYQNTSLELSNFLWFENNTPLEITERIRPPSYTNISQQELITIDSLQLLIDQLELLHPEMQVYDFKLASMEIERRLKAESLKPVINLNYNALNEPIGNDIIGGLSPNNYKWGFQFSFPVFLRKERGDLQLTKLKIQDTELNQQQKLLQLQNKLKGYYNEQVNLQRQIELYGQVVTNYNSMFEGEKQKFNSGESSLFLINSRENYLIQARLKFIELLAKYQVSQTGFIWSTGRLFEN